ncbi:hypothetical protein THAOC_37587, partial [Thalassiosira oceanica]
SAGRGDVVPAATVPTTRCRQSGAIPEGAGEGRRGPADVVVEKREGKSGGRALHGQGTLGPPVLLRGRTPPVARGTPNEDAASELEERVA